MVRKTLLFTKLAHFFLLDSVIVSYELYVDLSLDKSIFFHRIWQKY